MDIDFRQIAPRCGGQREAFEELCCQLASRTIPERSRFTRLHGAGGDGGVECFVDVPDSGRRGWQAKYVFDIGALLAQADDSLSTALAVHPTLTEYVVCFPFDVTGPTQRGGKSSLQKFEEWRKRRQSRALRQGRRLTIEAWPASRIRGLLIDHDTSGGVRAFFFDQTVFTPGWFADHLTLARKTAGPRYSPELNVKTDLWKWFAAFGRTRVWQVDFQLHLRACENGKRSISPVLAAEAPDC